MKSFGLAFLISGILLISLSGLEKILIYASLSDRAGDYQGLKMITPSEIWNITQLTFIFGIVLSILGLTMSTWKLIIKQIRMNNEQNRQFKTKHGLNRNNKEQ